MSSSVNRVIMHMEVVNVSEISISTFWGKNPAQALLGTVFNV